MNRSLILLAAAALLGVAWTGSAAPAESKAADAKGADAKSVIRKTLSDRFPDIHIDDISPSQFPGIYEIVVGDEIAYVNADASFLIQGRMLDTKTQEDLTQKKLDKLHAIDFDKLPFDLAIKTVKGNGARKLAVFADPHCPYCARLEQTMQSVDNVTVYTFLFPLESIHPGAKETAQKVWCAKDRSAAWTDVMLHQKEPAESCKSTVVQQTMALGDKMHINSTPTIYFADGHRREGALPQDRLEKELASSQK